MITELGKELRKLRIDEEERLREMAARLEKSASFISAVEVGTKAPPSGFEDLVIKVYGLVAEAAERIRLAADRSRSAFTIQPNTMIGRDTAGLLARRMNNLSPDQLKKIQDILSNGDV